MDVVVRVYRATESFPAHERYGLTGQMRRAAVSVPSNIAEGHARRGGAYLNHVRIALGSQAELGTEIEVALRLGVLDEDRAKALLNDVDRLRQMLYALRRSLQRRRNVAVSFGVMVFFCLMTPLM